LECRRLSQQLDESRSEVLQAQAAVREARERQRHHEHHLLQRVRAAQSHRDGATSSVAATATSPLNDAGTSTGSATAPTAVTAQSTLEALARVAGRISELPATRLERCGVESLAGVEQRLLEALSVLRRAHASAVEEQAQARKCVVCMEHAKTMLLLPCRHLCVCAACGARRELDRCPVCRQRVAERIDVYS